MTDNNFTGDSKNNATSREPNAKTQRIMVFQQNGSGEKKIAGIRKYGKSRFSISVISIDTPLPPVIDDATEYIPKDIVADLVLDFLKHPDLSHDLAAVCREKKIPVVASGKKMQIEGVHTPPTWCGLPGQVSLGRYGDMFGLPAFSVDVVDNRISRIEVVRGAPCGATWDAALRVAGLPVDEAAVRIGLEVQYFCVADPSAWDPISGKSSVHLAGEFHRAALKKAMALKAREQKE